MKNRVGTVLGARGWRMAVMIGLLAVTTVAGVSMQQAATANAATVKSIEPIKPVRYVDTRVDEITVDGKFAATGRVKGGSVLAIDVAGRPRVPADAAAVMMNVTAVRPDGPGHLTVFPCGTPQPIVSNVNYRGGDVAPNAVLAKIGSKGRVCVFSLRDTDLVVDINAYVPAGGSPVTVEPQRGVDTRLVVPGGSGASPGRLVGGNEYKFVIAGNAGLPADAEAAMMNITAVRPDGPGHVTVYPCGTKRPNVSSINYQGNDVVPNAVLSKLGTGGQICVYSLRDTHLLIDINGYVPKGGLPMPIEPGRLVDTRPGQTTADGKDAGAGRIVGGEAEGYALSGRPGLGYPTTAAMLNITVVRPDGPGHITVYACETRRPIVSSINYEGGDVVANAVFTTLGNQDRLCVYSVRNTDLIIDVTAVLPGSDDTGTTEPPKPTTCMIAGKEVTTTIPSKECDALIALYNSTGGPKWTDNDGWNTATDPCEWSGVGCSNGHVEAIRLSRNNLTGTIPSEIGDLPGLGALLMRYNSLSGPIPSSIGNLTNLGLLHLSANQLSGEIPASIGNLTNLGVLMLDSNALTGSIPTSIGNLTNLSYLSLTYNKLSGSIPASIGNLSNLGTLWLDRNALTGPLPASIGNLTDLETLTMPGNQLSGPIPNTIGNLRGLARLDLSGNEFSGQIPTTIGNLTDLDHLDIGGNGLTGPIPAQIGNLRGITWFNIGYNDLSGEVPTTLVNLGDPTFVVLSGNGCLIATDPTLVAWLNREDAGWNAGC